jgi:cytochrome c oxidase subunit 2
VPIRLTLVSEDVIHSFYVPAFRQKQDVLPGSYVHAGFEVAAAGTYDLFCAEYCGMSHSQMVGKVIALPPDDFNRWIESGETNQPTADLGGELFRSRGCVNCHGPDATVPGPELAGLFGRRVYLRDGKNVVADETYLRDAILLPEKQVARGFEPLMPAYDGQLDERELAALIEYLKSLQRTNYNELASARKTPNPRDNKSFSNGWLPDE